MCLRWLQPCAALGGKLPTFWYAVTRDDAQRLAAPLPLVKVSLTQSRGPNKILLFITIVVNDTRVGSMAYMYLVRCI